MEEQDFDGIATLDHYKLWVDEICARVEQNQKKLTEIEDFSISMTTKKHGKPPSKHIPGLRKHLLEASKREAASAKRMQDLMRNFGTILNQITRHKWAWPFMQPVDVEGLGLDDYYEVIDKPMDFGTIKNQMEAKDGTGYRHVRQICADVRLVFDNATRYNEEKSNVHVMAKTLLQKFEEKWLQFLPRVVEEEARREAEEAEAQLVLEAAYGKMARDLSRELCEIDTRVDELRDRVVRNCRKFSIEEKRKLGEGIAKLSPDDLSRVLAIVAESDRGFEAAAEEVELDINAQTEATLWRLKFFIKGALEVQGKVSGSTPDNGAGMGIMVSRGNENEKRKRAISNAIVRAAKKKSKITSS